MSHPQPGFGSSEEAAARTLIQLSLAEDHAHEDLTTSLCVDPSARTEAELRTREAGVLAGLPCLALTLQIFGVAELEVETLRADGDALDAGEAVARLRGPLAPVLSAERSFLNLICALSGVATLTRRYVDRAGEHCRVLDTRKTWPGWRVLQKYAVRCGGGHNHRMHLADAMMIKDNHHGSARTLEELVAVARDGHPEIILVVEADDLSVVKRCLQLPVDRILLDNFDAVAVREAVRLREDAGSKIPYEVSGGVHLDSVAELARAGADMVSVGALTHSAPALDLGLDLR